MFLQLLFHFPGCIAVVKHMKTNQNDHWWSDTSPNANKAENCFYSYKDAKAYNNVAPEDRVVGHLLQAGQQPWHDGAAEGGQNLEREQISHVSTCVHVVAAASIEGRAKRCSVQTVFSKSC